MSGAIAGYLTKRALLDRWRLISENAAGVEQVVIIPAFAEYPQLFQTLGDVAANPMEELQRTLVICVVNHRIGACREDIENNLRTLSSLKDYSRTSPLRLAWVDAASPGNELPEKDGVGLARKIGLDWGLSILAQNQHWDAPLISLDADTRVDTSYLSVIREFYASENRWAAVVNYAHPLDTPERAAILCYELFLRYHELGLAYAGSPYAFPTIGSTITCTARAYAASGGMNRRQAGEDFYFLQHLAKTGRVESITSTTVHPSPRTSHRVPFGTGRRVSTFFENSADAYLLYHPESYRVLKAWFGVLQHNRFSSSELILNHAREIAPELERFLVQQNFPEACARLQANHRDPDWLLCQFHAWFDAFRTLKLMHYLRDHGYPQQEMFDAIATLLQWLELPAPFPAVVEEHLDSQEELLSLLRALSSSRP
ncbi:MAG TPA: hypothetical protein PLI09_03095 [Candidatus Hydrogenedentes bacterium]|nr:hypothetical protein [Candidatus Hydrogenedentota bacterium]